MIIRRNPDGLMDEIIAANVDRLHIERLGVGRVALKLTIDNTYAILEIMRGKITLVEQGFTDGDNTRI